MSSEFESRPVSKWHSPGSRGIVDVLRDWFGLRSYRPSIGQMLQDGVWMAAYLNDTERSARWAFGQLDLRADGDLIACYFSPRKSNAHPTKILAIDTKTRRELTASAIDADAFLQFSARTADGPVLVAVPQRDLRLLEAAFQLDSP